MGPGQLLGETGAEMTLSKRNPDDTGPNKAHDFSVRVNGILSVNLSERAAWRLFIDNKLNGRVEMLRGPVVVARVGSKT